MSGRRQRNRTLNAVKWQSIGRQTAVNRRLRGCKCQSDDSEIALNTPSNSSRSAGKSIGAYGGANVSQTTAKSRLKTPSNGSQSALKAVNRQSIGAYGGANVRQTAAKSHSQTAGKCQSDGSEIALVKRQSIGASAVSRQRNRTQNAVKRQAVGRQMAVNRRLRQCKCQSDDSEIALKTPSNGSQSQAYRTQTPSNGQIGQSALTGVQMSVRRQRNRTQNAVKWQSVGSQMAVNRQSIGAYGGANGSQNGSEIALKTPSNGSQSGAGSAIGAYGGANVSQTTAKSHSKRRQTAVSRQANGSQSAVNRRLRDRVQMSVR